MNSSLQKDVFRTKLYPMKKIFIIMLFVSLVGCNKTVKEETINIEGTYKGVFNCDGKSANVNLKFYDSSFSGYSELSPNFPVVRFGTYIIDKTSGSITFINESVFDAQRPDSCVLNGHWNYSVKDSLITLTNEKKQEYKLVKK